MTCSTWDKGVAADAGVEWSQKAINLAAARRPHPATAIAADAIALVHEDIDHQVKAQFTRVVLWILDWSPANFKVLPVAVIPWTGQ